MSSRLASGADGMVRTTLASLGLLAAGLSPGWGQAASTSTLTQPVEVKPQQGLWDAAFFGYNRALMEMIRQASENASSPQSVSSATGTSQGNIQAQGAPAAGGPDPAFRLGEIYVFPNPARAGAKPVFHVEVGVADKVTIRVYDAAGREVHLVTLEQAPTLKDMGGGPRHAYEHVWDGSIASGVYFYVAEAEKSGEPKIRKAGKMSIVR